MQSQRWNHQLNHVPSSSIVHRGRRRWIWDELFTKFKNFLNTFFTNIRKLSEKFLKISENFWKILKISENFRKIQKFSQKFWNFLQTVRNTPFVPVATWKKTLTNTVARNDKQKIAHYKNPSVNKVTSMYCIDESEKKNEPCTLENKQDSQGHRTKNKTLLSPSHCHLDCTKMVGVHL